MPSACLISGAVAHPLGASFKMGGDALLFKALLDCLRFGRGAHGRLLHLFDGRHDRLRAIPQAVHPPQTAFIFALVILVEGAVDSAKNGLQRNSRLAPGFDQGPVERGEQKQRSAAALEVFLDFREVVEVVSSCTVVGASQASDCFGRVAIALVDQAQSLQGERSLTSEMCFDSPRSGAPGRRWRRTLVSGAESPAIMRSRSRRPSRCGPRTVRSADCRRYWCR